MICLELGFICCVLPRFGANLLRSASNLSQIAAKLPPNNAERSKLTENRCRTQQIGPESMQNAAKWPPINAERSKMTPNQSRTQQIDPESPQNAATSPQIHNNDPTFPQSNQILSHICIFFPVYTSFSEYLAIFASLHFWHEILVGENRS